ncbi:MAG: hypothetical protein ACR2KF_06695 [Nitrososphaeraceae archaeon]
MSFNVEDAVGKMNPSKLDELISSFDKDRNFFGSHTGEDEAMKFRDEFVSDFPSDKVSEMNIDEYVFGRTNASTDQTDKDTFCYRLEFNIPSAIQRGGEISKITYIPLSSHEPFKIDLAFLISSSIFVNFISGNE